MRYLVPVVGRGRLPLDLLHDRSLVEHALSAIPVDAREVALVVDDSISAPAGVAAVVRLDELTSYCAGHSVLIHDPLCPLTPRTFIADTAARFSTDRGFAAAAHRPVTDTIKQLVGGRIAATIDRERLGVLTSPLLLSEQALSALDGEWAELDFADLVNLLRNYGEVTLIEAPSLGRRVDDESAVMLLQSVAQMSPDSGR